MDDLYKRENGAMRSESKLERIGQYQENAGNMNNSGRRVYPAMVQRRHDEK